MPDVLTQAGSTLKQVFANAQFSRLIKSVTYHRVLEDADYDPTETEQTEDSDEFENIDMMMIRFIPEEVVRREDVRIGDVKGIFVSEDLADVDTLDDPMSDDDYLILPDSTRWNVKGVTRIPNDVEKVVTICQLRRHLA